ncbi:Metallo-hydrolase/oxidoreductase [Gymnopus androsaceus JB14]|uniref:Metallo-hydrolase/oxidoreductase n=1 Tax=Gymnopus androsaceus JB14 TaxID=1447944 RepID=A0A6A4IGL1_9AGAR|nr:Metallo-hydrolase/oxidoreductase [Gymnopus androsaceus JB14]
MSSLKSSAFSATRLTTSTFLIKEFDDIYSEHPLIYATLVPESHQTRSGTILLIDTGCGGASNDPDVQITSLREFIETVDVQDNDGRPLNPIDEEGGRMSYALIHHSVEQNQLTHNRCSSDSPILASSYSPKFISKSNIPENSLCNFLHIRTPEYVPTLVFDGHITHGMTILHTPGHTPDSLALYNSTSSPQMLYVGDTLYESAPIIFPNEGSIVDWFGSIERLIEFQKQILLNAGHVTYLRPALSILKAVKSFMEDVVEGREPVRRRWVKRGEESVGYKQGDGVFSLICPERLILDARRRRLGI